MIKLRATWTLPENAPAEEIEREYFDAHVPSVRRLPHLRRHNTIRFSRDPKGGPPVWWRGEEIYFDDVAALGDAASSPVWSECWDDTFSNRVGGPRIHVFTIEEEFFPVKPVAVTGAVAALSGIWQVPADQVPSEVDPVYFEVHVPGVRALPRLRCHTVMKAVDWPAGEHSRAWRSAEVRFATVDDFDATFDAPAYDAIRQDGFNASVAGPDVDIYTVEDWYPPA